MRPSLAAPVGRITDVAGRVWDSGITLRGLGPICRCHKDLLHAHLIGICLLSSVSIMTTSTAFPLSTSTPNWAALAAELEGITVISDPTQVSKLSSDWHTFSPILSRQLAGKSGERVIVPTTEAEVIRVIQACVRQRIPLTMRGAGTGNYGQCVPLQGGAILDMSRLNQVRWIQPGVARVQAGAKLGTIERQARELGWELRMMPSTFRTATVGGFVSGGFGGIGSIRYGILRERGNLLGLRVISMEEEPQILELRGETAHQVSHAWGVNGIVTELEIPLSPAYPWGEAIVAFEDLQQAVRFGQHLGESSGVITRMISLHAWPIPSYFTALQPHMPEGHHGVLVIASETSWEAFQECVQQFQGQICYHKPAESAGKGVTLAEYGFNHTTLHARTADPTLTYIDVLFAAGEAGLHQIDQLCRRFGEEVMVHIEYLRIKGQVIPSGGQVVRFTTEERLQEIMQIHRDLGVYVHNCHAYTLDELGKKDATHRQLQVQFKQRMDPHHLLNPGKLGI